MANDVVWRNRWLKAWAPLIGVTALAAALRFFGLGEIPPGLYRDEAFNGLDALRVLQGQWPVYFAANHGREPLFIYLIAAAVGTLGRTPGTVRLPAAFCGTLTVPVTYFMVHALVPSSPSQKKQSNHRIALLSATILAITLWHVHLSRVGFRAVTLPLMTALTLWVGARAFYAEGTLRRQRYWLLTGFLYGASFYTYLPIRFTPVILAIFGAYLLLAGYGERLWPGVAYFSISASLSLAPLAIFAVGHWDVAMGRPGQVSVFDPVVNKGDLWGTLLRQLVAVLKMFFIQGDTIPRHNVPGRPIFTPLLGAAMVLGAGWAVVRARRRNAGSALALLWVGGMLMPTWLAADAPHFLRAVGVLPLLVVFPALGLEAAWRWLGKRAGNGWASAVLCAILLSSLGATCRDYFFRYRADPRTAYAFEDAATRLAIEINRFTGTGWNGRGIRASNQRPVTNRPVYLDSRLWQAWEAIPFLVSDTENLTRFPPDAPPSPSPDEESLLLLWPHSGMKHYLSSLPQDVQIEAHAGPLTRGDLEKNPYTAYAAYLIKPTAGNSTAPLAYFGKRIALTDYEIETGGRTWKVRLKWRTKTALERDYTTFVYACDGECEGEELLAQDDEQPGDGLYPTHLWRPGNVVIDVHTLKLPEGQTTAPKLAVGWYTWPEMERLEVTKPSGEHAGEMLILPITNNQ